MPPATDPASAILCYGDPQLRGRSRPVAPDEDLAELTARMRAAMLADDGVGLAAPQVGDLRRVVIVADPAQQPLKPLVMVNPEVVERFGAVIPFEEGCLSFPGLFFTLERPRGVEVRYRDLAGRELVLRDDGVLARIIQHEVDHLDGVLFIDHLSRWRRWMLAGRLRRLRRQQRKAGR